MKFWRTPKAKTSAFTKFDNAPTLAECDLLALEKTYGFQLPGDYRHFLLENNGGFPSPNCVTFTDAGRKTASDVFCYFASGDNPPWASMEWHFNTFSGRLPKDTIPIARDSFGNLWLLKICGDNHDSVFFWDHGSYDTFDETDLGKWPRVATSFRESRDKLAEFRAEEEDQMPSRYALVNQAVAGLSKQNAGFSQRANPDFAWHCDCDDDGNVRMQFVQYAVHAAFTHTDGYSRIRAMKGLIKVGPTRLPG